MDYLLPKTFFHRHPCLMMKHHPTKRICFLFREKSIFEIKVCGSETFLSALFLTEFGGISKEVD